MHIHVTGFLQRGHGFAGAATAAALKVNFGIFVRDYSANLLHDFVVGNSRIAFDVVPPVFKCAANIYPYDLCARNYATANK
ncbi:MAG: hypothetical protein ACI9OO_001816 [Bacteroidia bacterium]